MGVSENIETVKSIYPLFFQGNLGAISELLSPEVDWEFGCSEATARLPWFTPGRGREYFMTFCQKAGEALRFESFDVLSVMGEGEWVVALCRLRAVNVANGKALVEECEPHVWRFDAQGRIVAMRHAADSLHHAEAAGLV